MPFCGVSRFVVTGFLAGSWSYGQGQQPFWGVGRLRLSCKGIAEPQSDKCNDSRLFYSYRIGVIFVTGAELLHDFLCKEKRK